MGFCSKFILIYGFIIGLLQWLLDIAYYSESEFVNNSLKNGCLVFIFMQPVWYIFIYFVYIASHTDIGTARERTIKMLITPIYAILQYFKVLAVSDRIHTMFISYF